MRLSYTCQTIQSNTDKIWKYQRYHLVMEHFDAPILPPPLNVFGYIIELLTLVFQFCLKKSYNLSKKQTSIKHGK